MSRNVPVKAEPYALKNKLRRIWRQFVRVMACIVVFCTTYAMILPAITMQRDTICGVTEHTHGMLCYVQLTSKTVTELTCTYESLGVHVHTAECLDELGQTVCCYADYLVHTHDDRCGDACAMPEISAHTHSEACYNTHAHDGACYTAVPGALLCQLHVHDDGCYDNGDPVCGLTEEAHVHGEDCYAPTLTCGEAEHTHESGCYENGDPICGVTAEDHTHGDACYAPTLTCAEAEHTHADGCYENGEPICGLTEEAHTHGDACYAPTLLCGEGDHAHEDSCYEEELVLSCGLEEVTPEDATLTCGQEEVILHSHGDDCYENGELACGLTAVEAHSHTGPCFTSTEIPLDDMETLTCTVTDESHLHIERCYGTWAMICGTEEHTHVESCYPAEQESEYDCGLTEHAHDDGCYDTEGALQCTLEPHSHAESGCEIVVDQDVAYVTYLIENLPSADEIDAKLAEFQAAGDEEGEEVWYTDISQQVSRAYFYYSMLYDAQKAQITNADKLLALTYIWSATPYITGITGINSATPTRAEYASTRDFIELNIYDYNYGIHSYWSDDNDNFKEYPGFQWNGGAYAKSNYVTNNSSADLGIPNKVVDRHYVDSIDFGNSIITNHEYRDPGSNTYGKSSTSTAVGKLYNNSEASSTGKINWLWYDGKDYASATNRPVGFSTQIEKSDGTILYTQSVANTLQNGYPALLDGTSLGYLFTDGATGVKKINTKSIEGLFQRDAVSGKYSFSSRENHAQYDTADYDGDGDTSEFILFDQIITPNFITYPFGNFLPFNTISDKTQATQVSAFNKAGGMKLYVDGIVGKLDAALKDGDTYGDTSRSQLKTMLREYEEDWTLNPNTINGNVSNWSNLSAANAIRDFFLGDSGGGDGPTDSLGFITGEYLSKMYNIDWDVATNFFFGMEMKMTFMQPKDGLTGNDTNGDGTPDYPMVFEFTGDDDVWVFIDDILFLDLTGIHRHVGGKIDFVNGWVYYYELSPETGDVSKNYARYSFAHLLRSAGREDLVDVLLKEENANGDRPFKDYSTHTFNFYYTERGSGSSVCRMNFNFPLLRKNSITVTKQNVPDQDVSVLGNPDYYFSIIPEYNAEKPMVGLDSVTGVSEYTILDSDGTTVGTGTVDKYGIFTLKAGQTAVFEGISENVGVFHVQELIPEADDNQYMKAVTINGIKYRNGNLIKWNLRPWYTEDSGEDGTLGPYKTRWYAYSSQKTDASSNSSFYFETKNGVKTANLGQLAITKALVVTKPGTAADQVFKMSVKLDDIPLPVGTSYTVDGEQKTVAAAGVIELKGGQTATISNILSGTKFEVSEDLSSARGFFVGYKRTDGGEAAVSGNTISGIVRHSATAALTVTNTDNAACVTLDGVKSIANAGAAQGENTFTFTLTEVDENGDALADGYTDTKTVTVANGADTAFGFKLYYRAADYDDGTVFPVTHRYRIRESGGDGFVSDGRGYIAWVTVNKDADGQLTAQLEELSLNGVAVKSMAFVNTLVGNMTLEKIVDGGALSRENDRFDFQIQFGPDDEPLADWNIQVVKNGEDAGTVSTGTEGIVNLTGIKHGDKVTLKGIPLGTVWRITESSTDGYIVDWTVNGTPGSSNVAEGDIPSGGAEVVYTNHSTYLLPETGGPGTNSYAMAGLMLMLCSTAFLLYRFKKRRREVT